MINVITDPLAPLCPLLTAVKGDTVHCVKEYCAWWWSDGATCSIKDISASLDAIQREMGEK